MKLNLTIVSKNLKSFTGDDGVEREYAWYKAEKNDGITIQFGSKNLKHEVGDNVELNLEKSEALRGGKVRIQYKEIV